MTMTEIGQAHQPAHAPAEHGGGGDLEQGAGDGDLAHLHQVGEREMQADPEHQQDDPDLGQLGGKFRVGDKTDGVRADDNPRDQISNERRQLQPIGQHAEHEGQHEAADQGENQAVGRRHRRSLRRAVTSSMGKRHICGLQRPGARL